MLSEKIERLADAVDKWLDNEPMLKSFLIAELNDIAASVFALESAVVPFYLRRRPGPEDRNVVPLRQRRCNAKPGEAK